MFFSLTNPPPRSPFLHPYLPRLALSFEPLVDRTALLDCSLSSSVSWETDLSTGNANSVDIFSLSITVGKFFGILWGFYWFQCGAMRWSRERLLWGVRVLVDELLWCPPYASRCASRFTNSSCKGNMRECSRRVTMRKMVEGMTLCYLYRPSVVAELYRALIVGWNSRLSEWRRIGVRFRSCSVLLEMIRFICSVAH